MTEDMNEPQITDLVALRMLRAIRDGGSISSAALQFGFTQQAVSARMQKLELHLGLTLLARGPRGTALTQAGLLVAEWSAELLDEADRLRGAVAALRSSGSRLRVSASLTIAEYLVPGWLVALRRHPVGEHVVVDLSPENSEGVIAAVRAGSADLGFVETAELPDDLQTRLIASDELVVVVAPDHRWARGRRQVSVHDLAVTPLVTREPGSGTRRSLEVLLRDHDPALVLSAPAAELQTAAAVRAVAASGIAPAVLSALAVRDDIALGRLVAVRVREVRLIRPLSAIWRSDRAPAEAASALLEVAAHTEPRR
ncbi:LysR family transcriptional regulator [Lysinimonas soli]|uniref:LysR family transcriptional regulator n=1 Tax=Lysinimonas soli TaxID=1074233 RepID=A0ABW0NW74_9MICO